MPHDQVKIKQESNNDGDSIVSSGKSYPWGTRLHFDDDMIDELGADALAVGDLVEVRGFALVDSKSENSDEDGTRKSIGLQLTSVSIKREEDDLVKQLYGA